MSNLKGSAYHHFRTVAVLNKLHIVGIIEQRTKMESESTEVSETNDVQTLGIRIIKSSGEPFTGMWIHFKLMEDAGIATVWLVSNSFFQHKIQICLYYC